jgi:hypothetical protein
MQEINKTLAINVIKAHIKGKSNIDEIDLSAVFKELIGSQYNESVNLQSGINTLNDQLKEQLKKITQANPNISPIDAFNLLEAKDRSLIDYICYIFQQLFSSISILGALSHATFPQVPKEVIAGLNSQVEAKMDEIIRFLQEDGISGLQSKTNDRESAGKHDVRQYVAQKDNHTFFVKDVVKSYMYKILTSIGNEGIREVFGSTFYHAMGVTNAAEAGVVVSSSSNKAVKIFSKKVGEVGDRVISLGQLKRLIEQEQSDALTEDQQAFKKIIGDHKNIGSFLDANPTLKQAIIDAHAVSMLAGNRDLHNDNIMIVMKHNGELQCAPIDFGLCGHNVSHLSPLNKLGFIKFNGEEMRHRDSLDLFTREEYKKSLSEIVGKFRKQRSVVEGKFAVTFAALQDKGVRGDYRLEKFLGNVEKNVRQAERFCGTSCETKQYQSK